MNANKTIRVCDKQFRLYISESEIKDMVDSVARQISSDLKDTDPIFCPTLTGAFMFMADLAKALDFDAAVQFVKFTSYRGLMSSGTVSSDLIFSEKCRNRDVVIVEDVVDSGLTMDYMLSEIKKLNPRSVRIATLLFKPNCFKQNFKIDYVGKSIDDDFIVGYGLDYNDYGRFYPEIYKIVEQ